MPREPTLYVLGADSGICRTYDNAPRLHHAVRNERCVGEQSKGLDPPRSLVHAHADDVLNDTVHVAHGTFDYWGAIPTILLVQKESSCTAHRQHGSAGEVHESLCTRGRCSHNS